MKWSVLAVVMAAVVPSPALLAQARTAALQRQVFAAESSFAASMAQRNLEAFASHVSSEAIFFGDTTVMRGKQAVLAGWKRFFANLIPHFPGVPT
jgi:ketosteroid isomerase-like protein